jgi:hypothetical protein
VEADFQAVLRSVTGKTNWIATEQRWLLLFGGGFVLLGWSVWAVYGIVWAVLFRKHPERATRSRAVCLGVVAISLSLGLCLSLILEGFKSDTPNSAPQLIGVLAALSAGTRSMKLWNWKPPPSVATPPAP